MRFLLPAHHLPTTIALLEEIPLAASASRARTKLLHLVRDAYQAFAEDEMEVVKAHAVCNEDGDPILDENGTFTLASPEDATEFHTARQALLEGRVEVAGATYENHARDVLAFLDTSTVELSGERAEAYDALYDAIAETLEAEGKGGRP